MSPKQSLFSLPSTPHQFTTHKENIALNIKLLQIENTKKNLKQITLSVKLSILI